MSMFRYLLPTLLSLAATSLHAEAMQTHCSMTSLSPLLKAEHFSSCRQTLSAPVVQASLSAAADDSSNTHYPDEVRRLLTTINPQNMWTNLGILTDFKDRYANSSYGVDAAGWIQNQIGLMTSGRSGATVYTIPTPGYKQPSVVLKIGDSTEPAVIISAYMDTPAPGLIINRRMPGAEGNGSGSVTLLEAARTILASDMQFKKPVYFIWFAAHNNEFLGASTVAQYFKDKKIPVDMMLHFEMTGRQVQDDPMMWLALNHTDAALNITVAGLINAYTGKKAAFTQCSYDCGSDHVLWMNAGIPASLAMDSRVEDISPDINTSADTMSQLSLQRMTDYLKLAVAYVVEKAEPVTDHT